MNPSGSNDGNKRKFIVRIELNKNDENTQWKIRNIDFDSFDHLMVVETKRKAAVAAAEAVVEGEGEQIGG